MPCVCTIRNFNVQNRQRSISKTVNSRFNFSAKQQQPMRRRSPRGNFLLEMASFNVELKSVLHLCSCAKKSRGNCSRSSLIHHRIKVFSFSRIGFLLLDSLLSIETNRPLFYSISQPARDQKFFEHSTKSGNIAEFIQPVDQS